MRSRIGILLGIALTLPVTTLSASGASSPRKLRPEVKALLQARTFADAGEFSGELAGTITVNGTVYRLAPEVMIYEIGRGRMPSGTLVYRRMMALSGVTVGGSAIVHQIIVRPASNGGAVSEAPIRGVPAGQSGPE